MENDNVNHPAHYRSHPSGIECIEITRHMGFNVGNAIKYLWRAGLKKGHISGVILGSTSELVLSNGHIEDLQKAVWYLNDEIQRLQKMK